MPETPAERQGRAANREYYHDGSRVRSYLTDQYHQVRRDAAMRLLLAARPATSMPVLELGCGSQSMLGELSDPPWPVVVADIAREALASRASQATASPASQATASPASQAAASQATAICLDATRPLPFREGSLAAIAMGELIEHVYDPLALLAECHRVLAADGVLVLTTPNLATLQDRFRFLVGRAPRHINPLHPYLSLHIRPFTATLLAEVLRHGGFEPLVLRSNFVMWRLPNGRWLRSRAWARLAPGLGGSLVMSARKVSPTYEPVGK